MIIEMLPARNGDCILLGHNGANILIDGGYVETYDSYLKDRLAALKSEGQKLNRLIVTHIDKDHISGVIRLLEENHSFQQAEVISIDQVWHNGYKHLVPQRTDEGISQRAGQLLRSIVEPIGESSAEKQISAQQGSSLGAYLLAGEYPWNTDAQERAIMASLEMEVAETFKISLLSPDEGKLKKLERFWYKELLKLGFNDKITSDEGFDDAFEFLLLKDRFKLNIQLGSSISHKGDSIEDRMKAQFIEDTRAPNGSSMAFVVECDGKRLLFLGDAHPSVVVTSLKKKYAEGDFPLYFDLIKVAHHGSFANNSPELLQLVDSPCYIISTNGQGDDHPDLETIAWIVGRKTSFKRMIHFNYNNSGYQFLDNKEWMEKYQYGISVPSEGSSEIITL